MSPRRSILVTAALAIAFTMVACSHDAPQACADPLYKSGGSSGGAKPAPPKPSAPKSGSGSGSGAKTPSAPAKPGSGSGSASKPAAPPKSSKQTAAAAKSSPKKPPDAESSAQAKAAAPPVVSRGGNYTSPVTGNVYIFHSSSYYRRPGIYVDLFDPYNPYNYWYWPSSPFYGRPYNYAGGGCGTEQKTVNEDKTNISITIDNDGKVVEAKDDNPKDPDLETAVDADSDPTEGTVPGSVPGA